MSHRAIETNPDFGHLCARRVGSGTATEVERSGDDDVKQADCRRPVSRDVGGSSNRLERRCARHAGRCRGFEHSCRLLHLLSENDLGKK